MSTLPEVRWMCTKGHKMNLLSLVLAHKEGWGQLVVEDVRQCAMIQVAVYQGAEEVTCNSPTTYAR